MYFCHSLQIWQQFPQLVPGLLIVEGIHPQVEVDALLQPWYQRARERLTQGLQESDLPEVLAWRRAYTQMGLKPPRRRPPPPAPFS